MLVENRNRNLFESSCEVLVNTVNCVGVMGAGIAKSFKARYPHNFTVYAQWCRSGQARPGVLLWVREKDRLICNFPTKRDWRNKSRLDDITCGLVSLAEEIKLRNIRSIALPKLGCGNGGLNIQDVLPLIYQHLSIENLHVEIYL